MTKSTDLSFLNKLENLCIEYGLMPITHITDLDAKKKH